MTFTDLEAYLKRRAQIKESDVVDLLETIMVSPYINGTIRQYVLTATAKLSTRFEPHSDQQARLRSLLGRFDSSVEVELQQRAVEFGELLSSAVSAGVLERMPPPELKASVMGTVSEKRAVGSTRADKDVRTASFSVHSILLMSRTVFTRPHGRRRLDDLARRRWSNKTDDARPPRRYLWLFLRCAAAAYFSSYLFSTSSIGRQRYHGPLRQRCTCAFRSCRFSTFLFSL